MKGLGRIIKLKTHRWWLFACQQAGVDVTWIAQKLMQIWHVFGLGVLAMYIIPTYSRRALSTSEILFFVQWKVSIEWTKLRQLSLCVWFKIWGANKEKYKFFQYDIASLVTHITFLNTQIILIAISRLICIHDPLTN